MSLEKTTAKPIEKLQTVIEYSLFEEYQTSGYALINVLDVESSTEEELEYTVLGSTSYELNQFKTDLEAKGWVYNEFYQGFAHLDSTFFIYVHDSIATDGKVNVIVTRLSYGVIYGTISSQLQTIGLPYYEGTFEYVVAYSASAISEE